MSTAIPGTSRDALLAKMDEGWAAFRGPMLALGARGLRERTPIGWTYAQMLAHVRAWHELTADRLRAYATTGAVEPPQGEAARGILRQLGLPPARVDALVRDWSTDGFNAAVSEAATDVPAHGFLPAVFASFKPLREAVAALTEEQIGAHVDDGRSFVEALVEGNTYGHYAEHQAELDAALPRDAAGLLARLDADWAPLRDAVRRKGRTGLAEPSIDDWTYKDLLAHVIGWLQDVPRRIEAIRAGSHKPISGPGEIESYNARSVSERKLAGPEAILDELDASYRLLRAALGGLSDAEVADARVRGLIATRTYLHWDEHAKELGL